MGVKWLIESDVFGHSAEAVKAEIRSQGMAHEVVHARPFLNGVVPEVAGRKLSSDDCVVFWGSPVLMRHIQLNYPWQPGGWCNFSNFDCTLYYPRLHPWLLNRDGHIGTIDELQRGTTEIFALYSKDSKVFVRPCCMEKVFTGQLVSAEDFAWMLERARYAKCSILVAKPRAISCEWRVIICQGSPIAASQYWRAGLLEVTSGCPERVLKFLSVVFSECRWVPDELFVVDVCESDGELYVLELNSFSCSGWYACNPAIVVAEATRVAREHGSKL